MTDLLMPFGKHKGKEIDEVPASYLLWFSEQEWSTKFMDILEHIAENREHLEREAEDEKFNN